MGCDGSIRTTLTIRSPVNCLDKGDYFAAGAAVFLLAEFFLRNASVRRFRCVRRSRFLSERRASSSLGFLWSANFAATFFFSLVSSDSLTVFFAIRIRASLYTALIVLTVGYTRELAV
jgi:hypothetical protein